MKLFAWIFSRKESLSTHDLVANEIRILVCDAMERRGIPKKQIKRETKDDLMNWFVINPWNAYEGGSHYGIPKITGHPGKDNSIWPTWLRHMPTSDLKDVRLELWGMARDRAPLGGHMMDEENKRRAVCEFAGNLLSELFEAEEQART